MIRAGSPALLLVVVSVVGVVSAVACRQDMHDQPKYRPLQPSSFFEDGTSARLPVPGTVARGHLRDDPVLYTGVSGRTEAGAPVYADLFPFPISRQDLDRGQQRYDVFCSVCHDRLGTGNGMVVRRGFPRAATLHDERLRDAPVGYLFDVISNGFGAMPQYSAQIPPQDRWKIVAYVRALQLSQNATVDDVPPDDRDELGL